jgi:hypothetical protein
LTAPAFQSILLSACKQASNKAFAADGAGALDLAYECSPDHVQSWRCHFCQCEAPDQAARDSGTKEELQSFTKVTRMGHAMLSLMDAMTLLIASFWILLCVSSLTAGFVASCSTIAIFPTAGFGWWSGDAMQKGG